MDPDEQRDAITRAIASQDEQMKGLMATQTQGAQLAQQAATNPGAQGPGPQGAFGYKHRPPPGSMQGGVMGPWQTGMRPGGGMGGGTPEEIQAKQMALSQRAGMRDGAMGAPQGMPPGGPKGGGSMPPGSTIADGAAGGMRGGGQSFGPDVNNFSPGAPPPNGGKFGGSSMAGGAADPNMPPPAPGGGGYAPKGAQSSFAGGM